MDDRTLALLHANLIEVFGERDPDARRDAARRTYTADVTFTDAEETVHGWEAVATKAGALQEGLPPGATFAEEGPVYTGAGRAALAWRLGPADGEPFVRGIDVVTIVDGRISDLLTLLVG